MADLLCYLVHLNLWISWRYWSRRLDKILRIPTMKYRAWVQWWHLMNLTRIFIHCEAFLTDKILLSLFILESWCTLSLTTHLALHILAHRFSQAHLIIGGHPFHHHVLIVFHRICQRCSNILWSLLWSVFDSATSAESILKDCTRRNWWSPCRSLFDLF